MKAFFNLKNFAIRHLIILFLAILFGGMENLNLFFKEGDLILDTELFRSIISTFFYIFLVWNGNMLISVLIPFDRFTWEKHAALKISIAGAVALLWPVIAHFFFAIYVYPLIHQHLCDLTSKESIIYLITSITITLLINSIFAATEFFQYWRSTVIEKEAIKRNSITAEFESLKNQVNPHFLFNALNTLSNLIEEEPKVATDFVQKLASVYRYVLSQKDKETVSLGEELDFINAYIFLNKIRFGDNLKVIIKVDPKALNKEIVTLTLQMLIENAIKHNVISKDNPLCITIESRNDQICVSNNLKVKTVLTGSNGIGLNNIVSRYSFLSEKKVEITNDGIRFSVSVPLL